MVFVYLEVADVRLLNDGTIIYGELATMLTCQIHVSMCEGPAKLYLEPVGAGNLTAIAQSLSGRTCRLVWICLSAMCWVL
jgi:hypothetical protein